MNQKKIGLFLKELRKERNITQEELSEIFGVTNRTVSRWENGINMPDFDLVIEITDYFDITIKEFLDGERKIDMRDKEIDETLLKVSEYEKNEKLRFTKKLHLIFIAAIISFIIYAVIDIIGLSTEGVYEDIASALLGFVFGALLCGALVTSRHMAKIQAFKKRLLNKER